MASMLPNNFMIIIQESFHLGSDRLDKERAQTEANLLDFSFDSHVHAHSHSHSQAERDHYAAVLTHEALDRIAI